ncbi:hypothetical protein HV824_23545 [Myxococcus sp. AM009]|uniref:hypothetical protein n=1 Tax=Myxococcus sp. AM009 TaxID=2745137 RepID=UPI001595D6EF|nr:hypothetical protein [Myxococcus sp. AM009]NVJ01072.1 hypothetical protein [Myxococcus sp. AM009]
MKNVFASRLLGGLVSVLLVVGCGVAPAGEEPAPAVESSAEGLTLERAPAGMQGTFSHDGSRVEFQSQALSADAVRLFVTVNGKRFDFEMDFSDGVLKSDGHEVVLSAQDRQALATFGFSLGSHLMQEGAPLRHELLVAVQAEYWSESPEGYVHRAKVMNADVSAMSNGNDGIACITKGRTYTAVYDRGTAGAITSKTVVANSNWGPNVCGGGDYNCMGRCGPGCGWGAPSAYTLDCLDHDTCSHDLCSSDGASDVNCGDEFSNAQDDWSLGVARGCFG